MSISFLQNLPVELLYRIFDNIDTKTIFLSLRYVCKRFYTVINNQNQYKLDFCLISKSDFDQVCHLIRPENVIDSKIFFNHIITCPLVSLSIEYQNEQTLNTTTLDLLSSTIEKLHNLLKFEFKFNKELIRNIQWPVYCTIRYLTFNSCTLIQLITILRDLHHLKTLIINNLNINESFVASSFQFTSSLRSLSIEQSFIHINTILFLLSLTPTLVHLKLTGWPSSDLLVSGSRWEEFIQTKLPELNKFEFFFRIVIKEQTIDDLQSIIAPYQTFFWLEDKQWYIYCDYIKDRCTLQIYSIPICEKKHIFDSDICSTLNTIKIDKKSLMNHISHLQVNFIPSITWTILQKNEKSNIQYFCNVTELTLCIANDWPQNSIEYLSIIIDFSHLIKLSLNSELDENSIINIPTIITDLIQRAHNLHSLAIFYPLSNLIHQYNMEWIYIKISNRLKHLKVDMIPRYETKILVNLLDHFSSITFNSTLNAYNEFIQCLKENKRDYIVRKTDRTVSVWLGRNQNDMCKVKHDVKRVKLTHDYST